jgi:hypothetical protein
VLDEVFLAPQQPNMAVITFHWDAHRVCPEASSALDHYVEALPDIVESLSRQGFDVHGHYHPRDQRLMRMWKHMGVPVIDNARGVRDRAGLLIADNTSMLYEFAHLRRPTGVLNAPWYRRDVHHGLRFWDFVPGHQFDGPEELMTFDWPSHYTNKTWVPLAEMASIAAYDTPFAMNDGMRAARWVTGLVRSL